MRAKPIILRILFTCVLLFTSVYAGSSPTSGVVPEKAGAVEIPEAYDCVVVSKTGETTPVKDLTQTTQEGFRFYPEGGAGKSIPARFEHLREIRFVSADNRLEFVSVKLTDRNGKESEGRIKNDLLAGYSHLGGDRPDWSAMPHNLRVIYMR
ncbi:MAG: hypothetical protein V3S89_10165 [Desulfobacterales bacterium]